MTAPDLIRHGVEEYLRLLQEGTAEDLTDLFTEDGFIEDPAGATPKVGKVTIREHFDLAKQFQMTTDLLAIRIVEDSCAAFFKVTTKTSDGTYVGAPIDVFTFDTAGRITSMRAYWGEHDTTDI